MERLVKVTRRGQTTIPVKLRRRFRIKEGSHLVVEATEDAIVMRPVTALEDLAGSLSKTTSRRKMNALLDEMEGDEE